jgi:hypothetical protein
MKRKRRGAGRRKRVFRLWTHAEARAAVPYLRSVMASLREHTLEALSAKREVSRLEQHPGRPDRDTLIALEEGRNRVEQAEKRFEEAASELWKLNIYPVDAVHGLAQVPFVHEEELAWYLFDLFDPTPFRFWRFQSDPEETRRPVTPLQKGQRGLTWKA